MQGILVGIIVLGCILFVIRRIIQYFRRINHQINPCEGCCGCDLYQKNKKIAQKSDLKFGSSKNSCTFASAIEKQR